MVGGTVSDVITRGARRKIEPRVALYVAFQASAPAAPPSRHILDGLDIVSFGRGPRAAIRRDIDGLRGLIIQLPDPMMSSEHGRLQRTDGAWQFHDPRSKNGALINGRSSRLTMIQPGTILQLGHTIFLLEQISLGESAAHDVTAEPLAAPLSELTTLHVGLASSVEDLARVAPTTVPILILGETGTGKEVLARAIHALSRRKGEMVAVNCGAIPATLIEPELFGHKKGTFSGSLTDRHGHLRTSDHGTLFLDEIGELPMTAQTALLRALQQREVVPVGASLPIPVDLRVVTATHRDLPALIAQDKFREDLYARLLGVTITLPPLRERRFDLGILINVLLRRLDPSGKARVTPAAARVLFAYRWPRNVRELERALAGGLARSGGEAIDVDHLPAEICAADVEDEPDATAVPPISTSSEEDKLRVELATVLRQHAGNINAAAKQLGCHREQLYRRVRRLGIDLGSFRPRAR